MAKKLGKKARKFAKKNLQSVMKKKRLTNAKFNRNRKPYSRKAGGDEGQEDKKNINSGLHEDRVTEGLGVDGVDLNIDFDSLSPADDDGMDDDASSSDGFLSEDPECPYISESDSESNSENTGDIAILEQNKQISEEIAEQKKKLNRLLKKDPKFSKFLESRRSFLHKSGVEMHSDGEDDASYLEEATTDEKLLTSSTVDVWSWLAIEQPNGPAFVTLLNGFRAACRYGANFDEASSRKIPNKDVFSKILTFVLLEADGIFRRLLGIRSSLTKDSISGLTNNSEWKSVRPLIKSYFRSGLFLLNQETESQILVFVLSRLRASCILFAAFPSLLRRLIKIIIHLWATGDRELSSSSYLMISDIASQLSSDYLDMCLTKMYRAFIAQCKFVEAKNLNHIEFMSNSLVDLYSFDIQKTYQIVFSSVHQLANILKQALTTKKKEELMKIHSWQYIFCVRLWVKFVSSNFQEYDLQALLFLIIQVVRGIDQLFPGPRYIPLRFKCIKMLNQLSMASGVFIPVSSLIFSCLEFQSSSSKEKHIDLSSLLMVPKNFLKSRALEEECVLYSIELLCDHFSQWSYHISFPDLATIPLILLKRYLDKTTIESLRRPIKRLIDQVQENIDFIKRKRDEASFSPNDQSSVDGFMQLTRSWNAPFTLYYASVQQNSLSRTLVN